MCDFANREEAMVVVERDPLTGVPTVWCDPCLVPLVRVLNAGGVRTVASCCGHGYRPGSISLTDGSELLIAKKVGHRDIPRSTRVNDGEETAS